MLTQMKLSFKSLTATVVVASLAVFQLTQVGCSSNKAPQKDSLSITQASFGKTPSGQEVSLFTLKNTKGAFVTITNYGGIVTSINVPDKAGKIGNVVLGFDSLSGYTNEAYTKACPFFGALIGRYGNRIALGKFSIDGTEYKLATNNGVNHLHGGVKGFDKVVWTPEIVSDSTSKSLKLTYLSVDGEEGYPGNLKVTVVYSFNDNNELKIQYSAETDKPTVLNLTNHSYFNLAGAGSGDILNHVVTINADGYTPVDAGLIPTGVIAPVASTPFDFTKPIKIGAHLKEVPGIPVGYDHNFVLSSKDAVKTAAVVTDSVSGRKLEVLTTEIGVQFYTGNFLDGSITVAGNNKANQYAAFCLETQHFPNSPNQASFPSTLLKPGEKLNSTTTYRFSVQ